MNLCVDSENKACISGESDSAIKLGNVVYVDKLFCKALVSVQSDWFTAHIPFEISLERVYEFIDTLNLLLSSDQGDANFINEDGNIDLDFELTKLGNVEIRCILSKGMVDESQIRFEFSSDRISLEKFSTGLKQLFNHRS